MVQLQDFMSKTGANEKTSAAWVAELAPFIARGKPEEQEIVFQALGTLLIAVTPQVLESLLGTLSKLNLKPMAHSLAVFTQLTKTALPKLWSSIMSAFNAALLCNQKFFIQAAGKKAKFLPDHGKEGADVAFFEKCAAHLIPSLATLTQMAPLVDKAGEMQEAQNNHKFDTVLSKTAIVMHQCLLIPSDCVFQALVPQLEALARAMGDLMGAQQALSLEQALQDIFQKYFASQILPVFFKACEPVYATVSNMEKAIPDGYEKLVEQKNVVQLKNVLFSKKTHEAVTTHQDLVLTATECMRGVIKSCGHLATGALLGKFRAHDSSLKAVRTYTTTVHGVNILIHKLPPPGAKNRERAAMIREYLGNGFMFLVFFVNFFGVGKPQIRFLWVSLANFIFN